MQVGIRIKRRGWADEEQRQRILTAPAEWRKSTSTDEKGRDIREGHRIKAPRGV